MTNPLNPARARPPARARLPLPARPPARPQTATAQSISSMLVRGAVVLRSFVKDSASPDAIAESIAKQWEHFYRRVLPRLQAVFVPLTLMVSLAHPGACLVVPAVGLVSRASF